MIALDDDLNIAYREPAELSRYIRSKVADQEGMFYIFIDEVKKYYIQSALSLKDARKERTELRPLLSVRDFFRKIIVTKSGMKPWIDEDGILHLGLYEFLLNPAALDL